MKLMKNIDSVVYRMGLAPSRKSARILITHGHFLINNKSVNIPSYLMFVGEVEIDDLKKLISSKTKIIALTHVSNVTGAILPIKKIVDLAKEKKIPVLVDGTQGAPHLKIDIQFDLACDRPDVDTNR